MRNSSIARMKFIEKLTKSKKNVLSEKYFEILKIRHMEKSDIDPYFIEE